MRLISISSLGGAANGFHENSRRALLYLAANFNWDEKSKENSETTDEPDAMKQKEKKGRMENKGEKRIYWAYITYDNIL